MTRVFFSTMLSCAVAVSAAAGTPALAKSKKDSSNCQAPAAAQPATMPKIHATAMRVMSATLQVINDVGQRPLAIETGDPRAWAPSQHQIEKDAKLWSKELAAQGALEAPKKSWLDADMAHLQRWVDLLNSEMKDVTPSDEMTKAMADMNKAFAELQSLTAGPTYENLKIAGAALAVRDNAKLVGKLARK